MSETSTLRQMIPVLISQLITMFTSGGIKRGAIGRMFKLKRALRTDPVWQWRVREDLEVYGRFGRGICAMREPVAERAEGPERTTSKARKSTSRKIKVDRDKLFRLATLSRDGDTKHPARIAAPQINIRMAMAVLEAPKAIPLRPEDLRPAILVESEGTNDPCLNIITIHRIWDGFYG